MPSTVAFGEGNQRCQPSDAWCYQRPHPSKPDMAPWLTTIGLVMDILGICLLYKYGAIGGSWIDAPMPKIIDIVREEHTAGPARNVIRNRRKARYGAGFGLSIAVLGFALQILAQWV